MDTFGIETYGERIANIYDSWYGPPGESVLALLQELSLGGRVLELGIGTGRIALPLRNRGVDIHGIDASPSMVERMREKPEGLSIPVTMGDFSKVGVDGEFQLIYIAFNTFFALTDQEKQLECLQNVFNHLSCDGSFLIEAFVPDTGRFQGGQCVRAVDIGENQVKIEISRHYSETQKIVSQHVLMSSSGTSFYPVTLRYVWPSELDMMARVAGMTLSNRWQDWDRSVFSSSSAKHVSIYSRK